MCRMVIHPSEYAKEFKDADLDSYNIKVAEKNTIKTMPDVYHGRKVAYALTRFSPLNLQVCHNLTQDLHAEDFIFSGDGWLDPGPEINCKKKLPADIEHIFRK